jgi:hypothetical protein
VDENKTIEVIYLGGDPEVDDATLFAAYRTADGGEDRVKLDHEEWTRLQAESMPYSFSIVADRLEAAIPA